ncbi:MAG: TPM domain-containing protein [Solibacillus sp.]
MRVLLCSMLFLLFSVPVFAEIPARPDVNPHVIDYSNVLDDGAEEEMRAFIKQIEEETTNQILLMTIDTIGELEPFEFGQQTIRQWGIGQDDVNNGMLIFATTGQGEGKNEVRIATGQGLSGQFPDGKLGRIIDAYMIPSLKDGDYTTAFVDVLDQIGYEMIGIIDDADPGEEYMGEDEELTWEEWFLIIFFIILGIVVIIGVIIGGDDDGDGSGGDSYDSAYDSSSSSGSSDSGYGGGDSDGGGSGRSF